jgi:hypothetical protein
VYVSPQLLAEQYLHSSAMAHHGLKYAAFPHFMVTPCVIATIEQLNCRFPA